MDIQLTAILLAFATEYNLKFAYCFDDETKTYHFRFQDRARTWSFYRYFTEEQLDSLAMPIEMVADKIVQDMKYVIERLGA